MNTIQKHIFAYICLKFGSYVDQRLSNIKHILDIEDMAVETQIQIQYGG